MLHIRWKNGINLMIRKLREKKGLAQIPIMIGLLIMAAIIPVATNLVQKNQENRSKAFLTSGGMCTIANDYTCINGDVHKCLPKLTMDGNGPLEWRLSNDCSTSGKKCLVSSDKKSASCEAKCDNTHAGGDIWCDNDVPMICKDGEAKLNTEERARVKAPSCPYGCSGGKCKEYVAPATGSAESPSMTQTETCPVTGFGDGSTGCYPKTTSSYSVTSCDGLTQKFPAYKYTTMGTCTDNSKICCKKDPAPSQDVRTCVSPNMCFTKSAGITSCSSFNAIYPEYVYNDTTQTCTSGQICCERKEKTTPKKCSELVKADCDNRQNECAWDGAPYSGSGKCVDKIIQTPVNGVCSDIIYSAAAPTGDKLCKTGIATSVTPENNLNYGGKDNLNGWTWTCKGINGGKDSVQCAALKEGGGNTVMTSFNICTTSGQCISKQFANINDCKNSTGSNYVKTADGLTLCVADNGESCNSICKAIVDNQICPGGTWKDQCSVDPSSLGYWCNPTTKKGEFNCDKCGSKCPTGTTCDSNQKKCIANSTNNGNKPIVSLGSNFNGSTFGKGELSYMINCTGTCSRVWVTMDGSIKKDVVATKNSIGSYSVNLGLDTVGVVSVTAKACSTDSSSCPSDNLGVSETQNITVAEISNCTPCIDKSLAKGKNLGNFNCSGVVDVQDFLDWKAEYIIGDQKNKKEVKNSWKGDADCDGKVTLTDLDIWLRNRSL